MPVAATTVAVALTAEGPLFGVSLIGPSGAGKTRLALSLMERCRFGRTALVADDVTLFRAANGALHATAPSRLAGQAELRGTAIVPVPALPQVIVEAALDLAPAPSRLPDADRRFAPLGAGAPDVPLLHAPPQGIGTIFLLRALRAGHSLRGGVDYGGNVNTQG